MLNSTSMVMRLFFKQINLTPQTRPAKIGQSEKGHSADRSCEYNFVPAL